jgi:hypothetical protein
MCHKQELNTEYQICLNNIFDFNAGSDQEDNGSAHPWLSTAPAAPQPHPYYPSANVHTACTDHTCGHGLGEQQSVMHVPYASSMVQLLAGVDIMIHAGYHL